MNSAAGNSVSSNQSSSAERLLIADVIALLRCPATGQRLVLRHVDGQAGVSSEDGSVSYEIRDGLVLFVTGRQDGAVKAETKDER